MHPIEIAVAATVATSVTLSLTTSLAASVGTSVGGSTGAASASASAGGAVPLVFGVQRFCSSKGLASNNTAPTQDAVAEGMGWAVGLFAWVRRPGDEGEMAEAGDYRRLQANGEELSSGDAWWQAYAPVDDGYPPKTFYDLINQLITTALVMTILLTLQCIGLCYWRHRANSAYYARQAFLNTNISIDVNLAEATSKPELPIFTDKPPPPPEPKKKKKSHHHHLVSLHEPGLAIVLPMEEDEPLVLGRSNIAEQAGHHHYKGVSHTHITLRRTQMGHHRGYELVSHSRHGTYVDGTRLLIDDPVPLEHGSFITFGKAHREVGFVFKEGEPVHTLKIFTPGELGMQRRVSETFEEPSRTAEEYIQEVSWTYAHLEHSEKRVSKHVGENSDLPFVADKAEISMGGAHMRRMSSGGGHKLSYDWYGNETKLPASPALQASQPARAPSNLPVPLQAQLSSPLNSPKSPQASWLEEQEKRMMEEEYDDGQAVSYTTHAVVRNGSGVAIVVKQPSVVKTPSIVKTPSVVKQPSVVTNGNGATTGEVDAFDQITNGDTMTQVSTRPHHSPHHSHRKHRKHHHHGEPSAIASPPPSPPMLAEKMASNPDSPLVKSAEYSKPPRPPPDSKRESALEPLRASISMSKRPSIPGSIGEPSGPKMIHFRPLPKILVFPNLFTVGLNILLTGLTDKATMLVATEQTYQYSWLGIVVLTFVGLYVASMLFAILHFYFGHREKLWIPLQPHEPKEVQDPFLRKFFTSSFRKCVSLRMRMKGDFELPEDETAEPARTERLLAQPFKLFKKTPSDQYTSLSQVMLSRSSGGWVIGILYDWLALTVQLTLAVLLGVGDAVDAESWVATTQIACVMSLQLGLALLLFITGPGVDRFECFVTALQFFLEGLGTTLLLVAGVESICGDEECKEGVGTAGFIVALCSIFVPAILNLYDAFLVPFFVRMRSKEKLTCGAVCQVLMGLFFIVPMTVLAACGISMPCIEMLMESAEEAAGGAEEAAEEAGEMSVEAPPDLAPPSGPGSGRTQREILM